MIYGPGGRFPGEPGGFVAARQDSRRAPTPRRYCVSPSATTSGSPAGSFNVKTAPSPTGTDVGSCRKDPAVGASTGRLAAPGLAGVQLRHRLGIQPAPLVVRTTGLPAPTDHLFRDTEAVYLRVSAVDGHELAVVDGCDPVDRLGVYLTKGLLFEDTPDREPEFAERLGVEGVGKTVSAAWAEQHYNRVRADDGHAAPERCLAVHLFGDDEPVHLEVSNTGFEDEVSRRVEAVRTREEYGRPLDPRAACLWIDGPASATGGVGVRR